MAILSPVKQERHLVAGTIEYSVVQNREALVVGYLIESNTIDLREKLLAFRVYFKLECRDDDLPINKHPSVG